MSFTEKKIADSLFGNMTYKFFFRSFTFFQLFYRFEHVSRLETNFRQFNIITKNYYVHYTYNMSDIRERVIFQQTVE